MKTMRNFIDRTTTKGVTGEEATSKIKIFTKTPTITDVHMPLDSTVIRFQLDSERLTTKNISSDMCHTDCLTYPTRRRATGQINRKTPTTSSIYLSAVKKTRDTWTATVSAFQKPLFRFKRLEKNDKTTRSHCQSRTACTSNRPWTTYA